MNKGSRKLQAQTLKEYTNHAITYDICEETRTDIHRKCQITLNYSNTYLYSPSLSSATFS